MELTAVPLRKVDSAQTSLALADPDIPAPRYPRAPSQGLALSLERRRLQLYMMLLLADVVVLLGSFALVIGLYSPVQFRNEEMLPAYLILPLFQTIAFYNATYSLDGLTNWRMAAGRALAALAISALMFNFFAFFAKANAEFSRVVVIAGLGITAVGIVLLRYAVARYVTSQWGPSATNRLFIDAGGPAVTIPDLYRVNAAEHGLRPDLDDPLALDRLSKYLRNMDMVIVSCAEEDRLAWSEVLRGSGLHGEVISEFAHQIGALAIARHPGADVTALVVSRGHLSLRSRVVKRLFDLAVALAALAVLSPVLALCALAIKLDDQGPVFFRQRRMGRGNRFFDIYKFRSMRVEKADAAGRRSASKDDDRITRVGRFLRKTSLDELPQLFNVIAGEMSIVGPRPHALGSQAGEKMFWQVDRKYWQRHCLRPGITGLAQVRGFRGATDTERDLTDRLNADMEYLNTWSLWGDIKIIFATVKVLVHDRAF
ncbi:sugar transferase [Alteraurantiacibacter palmitatis]|uniref:Sugar transferase n=1 Tax=Alteraurantiacibacter palmitatis TaxID=2054628 RepID=A0ABV7E5Q1_9SPHN